jgi:hypothetical protein
MFRRLRVGLALAMAALGVLAFVAPAQAAPAEGLGARPESRIAVKLTKTTIKATPHVAAAAGEVCETYAPEWLIFEVPTGIFLYSQTLFLQYCRDGNAITRLTAPPFTDVLIFDRRVVLDVLPVQPLPPLPTPVLDAVGPVDLLFQFPSGGGESIFVRVNVEGIVFPDGFQTSTLFFTPAF